MWTEDQIIRETRWSRTYANDERTCHCLESKFLDGSVSITLKELSSEWPSWSNSERFDFCQAIGCAPPDDSADIFRFLARDEDQRIRSMIALCIAQLLPTEESFPLLVTWANAAPDGQRANLLQAIAYTSDSRDHEVLLYHFRVLFKHPQLMDDADWCNHIAMELVWCIKHLLELGTPAVDLRSGYHKLSQHPCGLIREQVGRWLAVLFGDASTQESTS